MRKTKGVKRRKHGCVCAEFEIRGWMDGSGGFLKFIFKQEGEEGPLTNNSIVFPSKVHLCVRVCVHV